MATHGFHNPMGGLGADVDMDSGLPTAMRPRPSQRDQAQLQQQRQVQTEQMLLYALGQPPGSVVLEAQLRGAFLALEEMLTLLAGDMTVAVSRKVPDHARQLRVYLQAVDTALGAGQLRSLFARYAVMHLVARTLNVPWPDTPGFPAPGRDQAEGSPHGRR
jgi:hypothetical protein